ncbi:MAG: hypothetical protein HOH21_06960 [Acidimicrobiaceae bacterium]|nr:hypothetical protein [Acidimicrobiaceae bacterium]
MLTTGFRLWFGLCMAAVMAAVFAGYTSGATETGHISVGWKGGIGNHVSYVIILSAAAGLALVGLMAVAFRDADAEAQAEVLGMDEAPETQAVVGNSLWPIFGALGIGAVAVGLVVHPAIFVIGLCILVAVGVEWTMTNWSEKVSGDTEANAVARENLMRPIEIPVLGTIGIGVLVLAVSRVLLTSSVNGAVVVATIAGLVVFGGAMAVSKRPEMPRRAIRSILFVGCVVVLLAGILSAVNGEREFHQIGGGGSDDDTQVETDH